MKRASLKLAAAAVALVFAGHAAADVPLMNLVAGPVADKMFECGMIP